MPNPDLLQLLHQDMDDVVDWVRLEPEAAQAAVRQLFDYFGDETQPEIIRLNAGGAIIILPLPQKAVSGREWKSDYIWPRETLEYALDHLSRLKRTSLGEDLEETRKTLLECVLIHWYGMREMEKKEKA